MASVNLHTGFTHSPPPSILNWDVEICFLVFFFCSRAHHLLHPFKGAYFDQFILAFYEFANFETYIHHSKMHSGPPFGHLGLSTAGTPFFILRAMETKRRFHSTFLHHIWGMEFDHFQNARNSFRFTSFFIRHAFRC